ncbi:MAG: DeoR/GlpR family DNA-binding transcription regulator [Rhizobiaceae bacterium]
MAILGQVRQRGRVLVDELAELYTTTPQTIRKDLQILADAHEVMRFHGGASLLAGIEYTGFETRRNIATAEKDLIGQAVARRIPNSVALMINIGTTTAAVARNLKSHAGLKVVTDNVNIANELRAFPGVEVMVPGGVVRRSDGAILGEAAVDFIRQFRVDIAVIGASAIAADGALLDYDLREAHVARAIIENAHHVILAADSSKFERSAPVCIGNLSQVHALVTDRCSNETIREMCKEHRIELVEARPSA